MTWADSIPALLGTVVGGVVTIATQTFGDGRRNRAEVESERRLARRAEIDRERVTLRELLDRVSDDVAAIRAAISTTDECGNAERAEGLDPVLTDIRLRHDRALGLIALVDDPATRIAADNVYASFGSFVSAEIGWLVNEHSQPSAEDAIASVDALGTAVRASLDDLRSASEAV